MKVGVYDKIFGIYTNYEKKMFYLSVRYMYEHILFLIGYIQKYICRQAQ
jgi:hypothetical protein